MCTVIPNDFIHGLNAYCIHRAMSDSITRIVSQRTSRLQRRELVLMNIDFNFVAHKHASATVANGAKRRIVSISSRNSLSRLLSDCQQFNTSMTTSGSCASVLSTSKARYHRLVGIDWRLIVSQPLHANCDDVTAIWRLDRSQRIAMPGNWGRSHFARRWCDGPPLFGDIVGYRPQWIVLRWTDSGLVPLLNQISELLRDCGVDRARTPGEIIAPSRIPSISSVRCNAWIHSLPSFVRESPHQRQASAHPKRPMASVTNQWMLYDDPPHHILASTAPPSINESNNCCRCTRCCYCWKPRPSFSYQSASTLAVVFVAGHWFQRLLM